MTGADQMPVLMSPIQRTHVLALAIGARNAGIHRGCVYARVLAVSPANTTVAAYLTYLGATGHRPWA